MFFELVCVHEVALGDFESYACNILCVSNTRMLDSFECQIKTGKHMIDVRWFAGDRGRKDSAEINEFLEDWLDCELLVCCFVS